MAVAVGLLSVWPAVVWAQASSTATVRGRVLDPQSRPLAGAAVTVTSGTTGLSREAASDTGGQYVLADLPPGEYVLVVAAPGFAAQRFEAVTLNVGQVLDLDATLGVAGVKEAVVVDAASAGLVDTARSVVDTVFHFASSKAGCIQSSYWASVASST